MKLIFQANDYTKIAVNQFTWQTETLHYASRPGLIDNEAASPTTLLLAEQVALLSPGDCLILGSSSGLLPIITARRFPEHTIWALNHSWIACQMTRQTLALNQASNVYLPTEISVLPVKAESFQAVLIALPKGRRLAQRWLLEAYQALEMGGKLFLAGANDQGIQSVTRDATSLFGNTTVLAFKKGCRLVSFKKTDARLQLPAWAQAPGIAPGTWYLFEIDASCGRIPLYSLPGIFSYDRLDDGTQFLMNTWQPEPGKSVLDLGCGYGILGIVAAKTGTNQVDLVDENLLAVAAAQKNLLNNQISQARAFASDGLSEVEEHGYDEIVTNPPFHSGLAVNYAITQAFVQQSWQALNPGGLLWLVANRFIPYDKIIAQFFGKVTRLAETNRYYVLRAQKVN